MTRAATLHHRALWPRCVPVARALTLAVIAALLALGGCRSSSEAAPEPAAADEKTETAPTAPAGDQAVDDPVPGVLPGAPPRPVGQWPQRYAALLRADTVVVGLVRPQAMSRELERALGALQQLDADSESRVRRAFAEGLGDLVGLLEPADWAGLGFDADGYLLIQLTTGQGSGIEPAAAHIADALGRDDPVAALAAHREALLDSGFGLRVALPAADPVAALAFMRSALPSLPAVAATPIDGYDEVLAVGGHTLVGLRQVEGFILLDTALHPWLDEAHADPQHALQRRILEGLIAADAPPAPAPGLPGPRAGAANAFFAIDLARLGRLDSVGLLASAGAQPTPAQLTAARLSRELVERGPYRALTLEFTDEQGVAVSAWFARHHQALAETFSAQPTARIDGALATLGFSPLIMASDGPWSEARLAPGPDLELGTLLQALGDGGGVLPLLVPVWMSAMPALVWRDLVPAPARFIEPGSLERVELLVGDGIARDNPAVALMLLDPDGDIERHRHGLACLAQRRPVQGRCRDKDIELGKRATTRFGSQSLHYLLEQRTYEGRELVVLVASLDEALFTTLADAPLAPSEALGHARLDLEGLAGSGVSALLGDPLPVAARLLGSIDAEVALDADGLHWRARFGRAASIAHVASAVAPAFLAYVERGKEVEAFINLEALAVSAVAFHDSAGDGRYPAAEQPVCTDGGRLDGGRVTSGGDTWQQPPWRELGFRIELPHLYRYCYQSAPDASHFAAWAEASFEGATRDSRLCIVSERDAHSGEAIVGAVERLAEGRGCFSAAAP